MIPWLQADCATRLDTWRSTQRHRTLETITTAQGPEIEIAGKRYVNFCSNDYLGLSNHPTVRHALQSGVDHYGVGAGASALLSGRNRAHEELETALADYLGRDRALLFSSGYLANLGVLSALINRHDIVFHDRLNHASLLDAVKLSGAKHHRYPHADVAALAVQLSFAGERRKWVVTDGVFSMDGDLAPLTALSKACLAAQAVLVCDDAHGFGVMGAGRGSVNQLGLSQAEVPLLIVTFGKALGTVGAAVVGPAILIETLVQSSRTFIYDTALPPALAVATLAALQLCAKDTGIHTRLNDNIAHFRSGAARAGLTLMASETPIQPLIIGADGEALRAAAILRDHGLYVRAVRPPTVPAGTARLRICISAAHTFAQIDALIAALRGLQSRPARPT